MEPNRNENQNSPRAVRISSLRSQPAGAASRGPVGLVVEAPQGPFGTPPVPAGADLLFPPNFPPNNPPCSSTAVAPHGGAIGTADPVQLVFWGAVWQTTLAALLNSFVAAVRAILAGPYMSGVRQYGVKRCSFGGALIITDPGPPLVPSLFTDQTIQGVVYSLIDQGTFPEPDEAGGRNLYVILVPPNTQYQNPPGIQAVGAHSWVQSGSGIDPDIAWVAWVGNNTLAAMTSIFSHELVEMCTDPEGDAWFIDGAPPQCSEIGDTCTGLSRLVNGVNVQAYWSIFDNQCLIPTEWSLRRTLAGAGIKLSGQGLRSFFGPIPSLNQFIVNL
jgi:hypothetical protein